VERLSPVIWVKPARDHLDGLAADGSKSNEQKEEKKRAAKYLTMGEIGKCHGIILLN
jgi:hypothetical protein